jgi:hypothetical protein
MYGSIRKHGNQRHFTHVRISIEHWSIFRDCKNTTKTEYLVNQNYAIPLNLRNMFEIVLTPVVEKKY